MKPLQRSLCSWVVQRHIMLSGNKDVNFFLAQFLLNNKYVPDLSPSEFKNLKVGKNVNLDVKTIANVPMFKHPLIGTCTL